MPGNVPQVRSCRVCILCHAVPIGGDDKWQWLTVEEDERNYKFGLFGESESKY